MFYWDIESLKFSGSRNDMTENVFLSVSRKRFILYVDCNAVFTSRSLWALRVILNHVNRLCFCRKLLPTWYPSTDMTSGSPAPSKPGTDPEHTCHTQTAQGLSPVGFYWLIDWLVCVSGRRTAASSCTTGRRWSTERTDTAGRKGRMERRREKTTWSWRSRAWRSAACAHTHLSTAAPPAGRTVSQHSRRNTVCEIIEGGNKMHLLPWTLSLWIKTKLVSTSCFRSVS